VDSTVRIHLISLHPVSYAKANEELYAYELVMYFVLEHSPRKCRFSRRVAPCLLKVATSESIVTLSSNTDVHLASPLCLIAHCCPSLRLLPPQLLCLTTLMPPRYGHTRVVSHRCFRTRGSGSRGMCALPYAVSRLSAISIRRQRHFLATIVGRCTLTDSVLPRVGYFHKVCTAYREVPRRSCTAYFGLINVAAAAPQNR
jgi:hypothetical protein